jgi:hypothetical protein
MTLAGAEAITRATTDINWILRVACRGIIYLESKARSS